MKTPIDIDASHTANGLPPLTPEQQAHAAACAAMLRAEIAAQGGWISFARFMEQALYAPGQGYYAAGARKFGADGDFITAPEISPLFSACLARCLTPAMHRPGAVLLELGPGSGILAEQMLLALDTLDALPDEYLLLEVSAELVERQQLRLSQLPAHLASRCRWIQTLPHALTGAIVANEVLDVLPVHLIAYRDSQPVERGVALDGDAFIWQERRIASDDVRLLAERIGRECFGGRPPEGYITEVSPQAMALTRTLVTSLKTGAALFIDYGFRRAEYYHADRSSGTLMCHYRHFAHSDPFRFPGIQDITAHVDFSSIAQAGIEAGGTLMGYATQAQFLLAAGIADLLTPSDPVDALAHLRTTRQAQRLLSPAEMGEFFKVIGFGAGGFSLPVFDSLRQLPL